MMNEQCHFSLRTAVMQQERLVPAPAGAGAPVRGMQVLLQVTEASVRTEAPVLADFSTNFGLTKT